MADSEFQRFSDRYFRVSPLFTQAGWYIKLRDGAVDGPFPTKEEAQAMLFNLFGISPDCSEKQIFSTEDPGIVAYSDDSRSS
ncbi:MAG: hypothetical protein OQK78_00685 [Gammaproteobacteria bacterium]|nr:hypothetical protein [Gammaproteobacteria bacterium]